MSLLPANATDTEKALEAASARLAEVPIPVATVGDAAEAPANVLPFLAWAKSVDVWDKTWSEATRRQVIAAAPAVHRVKGTPGSIEDAFTAAGYAVTIIERVGARRYDGGTAHNGLCLYGPDGGWAMYRIVVDQAVRNDQVAGIRDMLRSNAARRCHLLSLDYTEAANLYDGTSLYDGVYNHGVAE
tara:strand:- start:47130 stop:47687 length:558 start_codon:yes stop_codon:yes gene_type:complete